MHYVVYSGVVSSFYVVISSIDVIKNNQREFEGGRYTCITVEPRCSRGLKDWQNLFVIERFISTYFTVTGANNIVLYGGLRYVGVRCIDIPLFDPITLK